MKKTLSLILALMMTVLTVNIHAENTYTASDWAKEELKKAAEDDPTKPIFVQQHYHITNTVYGSDLWGTDVFTSILNKYPQVIDFSGHSHYPINDPRSIWQGRFTALGCGTLAYFELEFLQETNRKTTKTPKMKSLNESVVTGSHGTSENIN